MHFPLFHELIVILALAGAILFLFRKAKLPGILAFIITGMIAGPHGFKWVGEVEQVEALAEVGVIFLLFVIGIEFSLKKLAALGRTVFIGGSLQALLTIAGVAGLLALGDMQVERAVFIGFLVTLSSTAIVLRVLQEKGKMDSPWGRVSTAILIFQDIIVVPMMLVTPLLAGQSENIGADLLMLFGKVLLLLAAVYLSARYIVPKLLAAAIKGKGNELFIITVVVICFAAAYATQAMGLSLALGAFFAGLVISETDHAYHATGIVLPFHELFLSFFFVSIGMLVDLELFLERPIMIIGLALGATVLKIFAAFFSVWVLRHSVRTSLQSGLALFQLGEFGFILAIPGLRSGLLSQEHYQLFLAVSILGMAATPFMLAYSDQVVRKVLLSFVPTAVTERMDRLMHVKRQQMAPLAQVMKDHVVVIGFGLNGQNVARAAMNVKVRCVVIEEDPDLVRLANSQGHHIIHGDASNAHVLEKARIELARVVVVAISDAEETRKIVAEIRSHTSTAYIIVRTRYVREIEENLRLGANEVIPEEFETSIEIFYRVLRKYLVPEDRIQALVGQFRAQHYGMFRDTGKEVAGTVKDPSKETLVIPGLEIATLPVTLARSKVVGHTIKDAQLREKYGITVLAVRRSGRYITSVNGSLKIMPDDLLYLLGSPDNIVKLDRDLR
jgi:CPA2 family monovalent cation:H+ antiporter-2